jgi:hypothetical protein
VVVGWYLDPLADAWFISGINPFNAGQARTRAP